jgi:hypothetical protein
MHYVSTWEISFKEIFEEFPVSGTLDLTLATERFYWTHLQGRSYEDKCLWLASNYDYAREWVLDYLIGMGY